MAFSKVDIANLALEHLGKNEIASLTENSTEAKRCNKWIDWAIDMALARQPWTFATKIVTLAEVTNDYTERWDKKFDLPSDIVKVQYLVGTSDPFMPVDPIHYEIMGGSLYTNEGIAKLKYSYRNDSPTTWPPKFSEAVSFLLARTVAMPLTRKASLFDAMDQLYERAILQAAEIDAGQEVKYYGYDNSGYTAARGSEDSGQIPGKNVDGSIYWD